MAEQSVTLQPGESKVVSFEATPHEARTYQVSVNGLTGSFVAIEQLVTFSVEVYNIPSYAAGSYQWYIDYGGKRHGMIDPQAGIWTPISDPIVVANVPPSGTLQATLMAGPYKVWTFSAPRAFRDGESYKFNLEAGIIEGPGIVLTDLIIEPTTVNVGEPVNIAVTAINTGETSESKGVTFIVNDEVVKSKTVSLGPGESKELSIAVTPSEPGSYDVIVNELSGRFDVTTAYPGYICLRGLLLDPSEIAYSSHTNRYVFKMIGFACQPATAYGEWYSYIFRVGGEYWKTISLPGNRYYLTPEGCLPFDEWFPNYYRHIIFNTPLERGTYIITCICEHKVEEEGGIFRTIETFDLGDTGLRVTIV